MPPLSTTAPNPAPLNAWRGVVGDAPRITLNDQHQPETQGLFTPFGDSYRIDNESAFDNLFTAIHGNANWAAPAVRALLEGYRDGGEPLTGRLVQMVMHIVDNSAAQLCDAWDERAKTENLSPRTPGGDQAYGEFLTLLSNRCVAVNAFTPDEAGAVLDTIMEEIRNAPVVGPAVKERFLAYAGMMRENMRFSQNAPNSPFEPIRNMKDPLNCWQLVMDGRHHDKPLGCAYFENECGYMHGMLRAFNHMLAHVNDPLTPESYAELHDQAVGGVHERDHVGTGGLMKLGFREGAVGFGLVYSNMSGDGRDEFEASPKNGAGWCSIVDNFKDGAPGLVTGSHTAQQCREKAAEIIQAYHQALLDAPLDGPARETAILRAIATCCQDLDQHHLFSDGNIRSVAFLVMNKLLLQNGLSPTLFDNPNVIDMHSVDELVELMRAGQQRFALM